MCERDKNMILQHRLVCKAFDLALRNAVFKTLQLEFSRLLRHVPTPDPGSLSRVGDLCEALYLDLMVVRDEGMSTPLPPSGAGEGKQTESAC